MFKVCKDVFQKKFFNLRGQLRYSMLCAVGVLPCIFSGLPVLASKARAFGEVPKDCYFTEAVRSEIDATIECFEGFTELCSGDTASEELDDAIGEIVEKLRELQQLSVAEKSLLPRQQGKVRRALFALGECIVAHPERELMRQIFWQEADRLAKIFAWKLWESKHRKELSYCMRWAKFKRYFFWVKPTFTFYMTGGAAIVLGKKLYTEFQPDWKWFKGEKDEPTVAQEVTPAPPPNPQPTGITGSKRVV